MGPRGSGRSKMDSSAPSITPRDASEQLAADSAAMHSPSSLQCKGALGGVLLLLNRRSKLE